MAKSVPGQTKRTPQSPGTARSTSTAQTKRNPQTPSTSTAQTKRTGRSNGTGQTASTGPAAGTTQTERTGQSTSPGPATGVARRRQRLSDAETADRMLAAARAMVVDGGLTVSLEHLSFEDVIRDAGVARSAVYRRWPYKDLFWADVLVELASGVAPAVRANQDAIAAVNSTLLGWVDRLEQPGARLAAAADALQQGALREFESFDSSPQWRTYFAIHATYFSLPDGELRERVGAALVQAEDAFNADLADSYRSIADMLGLRVMPETGLDFPAIAVLAMGLIRGLVLMAPGNPQIAARRFPAPAADAEPRAAADAEPGAAADAGPSPAADAAGGGAHSGWSLPAVGLAALTVDQLEADPAVRWDAARTDRLRNALTGSSWAPGPAGTAGNRH